MVVNEWDILLKIKYLQKILALIKFPQETWGPPWFFPTAKHLNVTSS